MRPEERIAREPDEQPPLGDRRFSQLPGEDRWRLVKEALHELYSRQDYWFLNLIKVYERDYWFIKLIKVVYGFALGVSIGIAISVAFYRAVYRYTQSTSFGLWFDFQFLLIFVILLAGWFFGYRAVKLVAELTRVLSDLEVEISASVRPLLERND